jgi:hypothetical protein
MIEVIENTYPVTGHLKSLNSTYDVMFELLFTSNTPKTQIDCDFLNQGRHDHKTGWSTVIHGKATGTTTRFDDNVKHGRFDPGQVSHEYSGTFNEFTVAQNDVLSIEKLGYGRKRITIRTSPGDSGYAIARRTSGNTLTTEDWEAIICAWSSTVRDGRVYTHWIVTKQSFRQNKLTRRISVGGLGSRSQGVATEGRPAYPVQDGELMELDGAIYSALAWTLEVSMMKTFVSPSVVPSSYSTYGAPKDLGPYRSDSDIKEIVRKSLLHLASKAHGALYEDVYELEATAFDSINRFDGNMLALIPDLRNIGKSTVNSVLDVMKSGKNPRRLASAWLSNRYGDQLTFSDMKSLFAGFTRSAWHNTRHARFLRGRSRRQSVSPDGKIHYAFSCQVAVVPKDYNAAMSAIRKAYEWDYYPSLGNMWDLVPLSFVVDWFVDVSSIFEDLDRMVQARYYNVVCVLLTVKASTGCDTLSGVNLSFYDRTTTKELSLGVSSVELGLPSAVNIVDGVALLLM